MSRTIGAACALALGATAAIAAPTVYPTGVTIYDPAKTWSGYTVLSPLRARGAVVIDMNGRVVKSWEGYDSGAGGPARVLPGGNVMGAAGANPGHQESLELVARDFDGKVLWRLDRNEEIEAQGGGKRQSLRQHHDWQREDFPAGYFSPSAQPKPVGARTLVLTHHNHVVPKISSRMLEDDRLIEVTPDGKVAWEWLAADHVDEMGFDAQARAAIAKVPAGRAERGFDWLHINSAHYVGPNKWYDAGDKRFAPNNVIISSRQASFIAVVGRDGRIVWRIGPDFRQPEALKAVGQILGQHHAHLIPPGLPGAGNLLVFDNGGSSGYGFDNPNAPDGVGAFARASSRVVEINPVTLALVWSYTAPPARFFSTNISSAQRLPNGNTLIDEGNGGRMFEVTSDGKTVWEFLYPDFTGGANNVYRAYRIPYEWLPQVARPKETPVVPPDLAAFHLP
jgi:hypothetical protein